MKVIGSRVMPVARVLFITLMEISMRVIGIITSAMGSESTRLPRVLDTKETGKTISSGARVKSSGHKMEVSTLANSQRVKSKVKASTSGQTVRFMMDSG